MKNRWLKVFIILVGVICMTGCSTSLRKRSSTDTNDLIAYNVYSDMNFLLEQNNSLLLADEEISKQNLSESDYNKKSAILMVQNLENVYKICNNRVLQDFDNAYTYDENYQDYLTMMSKYVDTYLSENANLRQWMAEGNLDAIFASESYKYNIFLINFAGEINS